MTDSSQCYRPLKLSLLVSLGLHGALLGQHTTWYQYAASNTTPPTLSVELVGVALSVQPQAQSTLNRSRPRRPVRAAPKPTVVVPSNKPEDSVLATTKPAAAPQPTDSSLAPEPASAVPPGAENATAQQSDSVPPRYDVDYLHNPPPPYPALARRLYLEGTVLLMVYVDAQGLPQEIRVDRSSGHAILDRAAAETVRGWRFVPARRGSITVEEWVRVPIAFRLTE